MSNKSYLANVLDEIIDKLINIRETADFDSGATISSINIMLPELERITNTIDRNCDFLISKQHQSNNNICDTGTVEIISVSDADGLDDILKQILNLSTDRRFDFD